jgi:hypothetical protein
MRSARIIVVALAVLAPCAVAKGQAVPPASGATPPVQSSRVSASGPGTLVPPRRATETCYWDVLPRRATETCYPWPAERGAVSSSTARWYR